MLSTILSIDSVSTIFAVVPQLDHLKCRLAEGIGIHCHY